MQIIEQNRPLSTKTQPGMRSKKKLKHKVGNKKIAHLKRIARFWKILVRLYHFGTSFGIPFNINHQTPHHLSKKDRF
jgi:hypothetical protein